LIYGGCSRTRTCDPLIKSQNYSADFVRFFSQLGAKAPVIHQWVTIKFPTEKGPPISRRAWRPMPSLAGAERWRFRDGAPGRGNAESRGASGPRRGHGQAVSGDDPSSSSITSAIGVPSAVVYTMLVASNKYVNSSHI
jgi:hypothetical protein